MKDAIVVFSAGDWWNHSHAHADFQLSLHLQNRVPVLIVNSMGMRRPGLGSAGGRARILRKVKSMLRPPQRVGDRLWVLSPVFVPAYSSKALLRLNSFLVSSQVRMTTLLFMRVRTVGVVFANPVAAPVVAQLRPRQTVFYRVDWNSRLRDGDRASIESLEKAAFTIADTVVYSSASLREIERAETGCKSVVMRHGYNAGLFAGLEQVERTKGTVGFVGSLEEPERLRRIVRLANAMPEARFIAVGAISSLDASSQVVLPTNLELRSAVPHEVVPSLLAGFHVGLLLTPEDEWGMVASPIKLVEYLAAGLTVVGNRTTELDHYAGECILGSTDEELVEAIRLALHSSRHPSEARALVSGLTWQDRADKMLEFLHVD